MEEQTQNSTPVTTGQPVMGSMPKAQKAGKSWWRWLVGGDACCAHWGQIPLRIVVAAVFIGHGFPKLFGGHAGTVGFFTTLNIPAPEIMAWVVGSVEFFGGIAILLGLLTPLFASLLAIDMLFAWWLVKLGDGLIENGLVAGELELALLAIALSLALTGAGRWSIDSLLTKKRT